MSMSGKPKFIITVDGPAGSGKSTVGKALAKRFNFSFLSSGKIYRALAYLTELYGYERSKELISKIEVDREGNIFFEGEELDSKISSEAIGRRASELSREREVRETVNRIQRKIVYGSDSSFVVEGRDEGTEVFREANVKIFLWASLEERARRKYLEQTEKPLEYFLQMIKERDEMDSKRDISPMRIPEGAIFFDSTSKTVEEVVEHLVKEILSREPKIADT